MRVVGKTLLLKYEKKHLGDRKLCRAIDKLLADLESFDPYDVKLKDIRSDADLVHPDGYYFFDISVHRTLILDELDNDGEAKIIWVGNHQEYERQFKNNKSTIEKWLRATNHIE